MDRTLTPQRCVSLGARLDVITGRLAKELTEAETNLIVDVIQVLYSLADGRRLQVAQSAAPLLIEAVRETENLRRDYVGVYAKNEAGKMDGASFDVLDAVSPYFDWLRKAQELLESPFTKDPE